jgi:pimeloyl-ACP methyl ester carboxylesterase
MQPVVNESVFVVKQNKMKSLYTLIIVLCYASIFAMDKNLERVSIPVGKYKIDGLAVSGKGQSIENVIIFLGGSGSWEIVDTYLNEDPHAYGNLVRYYVEENFVSKNLMVLYLNKRGLGKSTGNWRKSGIEERAEDAVEAVRFVKEKYKVTEEHIGLIGHSQGCWVAQLAALQTKVCFVINLAGPFMGPEKQTHINRFKDMECTNLSEMQKRRKMRWSKIELGLGKAIGPVIGGEAKHWSKLARYNHEETIKKTTTATLFIFAEYDHMVPYSENMEYGRQLFSGKLPELFQIYYQQGIDHYLHRAKSACDPYPWTLNPAPPYSDTLQSQIKQFISKQLKINS